MNVGAFCAQAKRKAINNGTKIADVMENTLVTQDCQDAYFGCMDTFCMSENVSGGRCKCNDKNAQFDEIFAQLQSVNQKNYLVHQDATSLLKMGKNADDVYAMTKSFATRKSAEKKKKFVSSGVNQGLFFENEDDEDFEDDDSELIDKLLNKSGDELHVAVASLCSQRVPEKCQSTLSMLRSLYVNKIQSDCAAYENSLKQTQDETNQKLTEAKRSLRDTATEKYQSENKYDLGGCVSEYLSCMQQEDTCGEDFGFCVSLAANDRLKNKNVKLKSEKIGIKLTASTFDQLMSKRPLCDGILEQCVKVKDQVWDEFLLRATPTIAMAEFNAESDLRKNCVSTISECFREKCKNPLGNQKSETASAKDDKKTLNIGYDDCLTDPELYKSLCKVELEPCLIASGGTYEQPQKSSLWGYIVAKLAAMKVGACTKQVRECLLADDACGENYAGCIGMTADAIGRLCDFRKLTACMTENKNDENAVRSYIARVGQGIALEINNSMIQNCENALKTAMVSYCGAENGCPNATIDTGVFKNMMTVEFCNGDKCDADLSKFDDYKEILAGNVSPQVKGKMDLSVMQYSIPTDSNSYDVFFVDGTDVEGADSLANIKTLLNVEVMNKDAEICTLDNGAVLDMEITLNSGRGYVPASVNAVDLPLGTIPVDSIYSPILNVASNVTQTRVGQSTDYDKLELTVKTNGAVAPEDAIAFAARILTDQLNVFINFEDPMMVSVAEDEEKAKDVLPFDPKLLKHVDELELSVRATNCLKNDKINWLGELVQKTENDMLKTPNFGRKSLNEIKVQLEAMGLSLGMEVPGWPPENIAELAKKYEDPYK